MQTIGQLARRVVEQAGRAREAANENRSERGEGSENFSVQQPQLHGRASTHDPRNARPAPLRPAANDNRRVK